MLELQVKPRCVRLELSTSFLWKRRYGNDLKNIRNFLSLHCTYSYDVNPFYKT